MNHVANKGITKKKGKIFTFFADLRAAFDKVDRMKLREKLKKTEMKEKLRKRIMGTYKETKNMVRVGDSKSEEFWTENGVRQGCPMSPTLFNVYIMDIEEEMKKEQNGGVVIGREKIWSLSYEDDVVLIAEKEKDLKAMMSRFKK